MYQRAFGKLRITDCSWPISLRAPVVPTLRSDHQNRIRVLKLPAGEDCPAAVNLGEADYSLGYDSSSIFGSCRGSSCGECGPVRTRAVGRVWAHLAPTQDGLPPGSWFGTGNPLQGSTARLNWHRKGEFFSGGQGQSLIGCTLHGPGLMTLGPCSPSEVPCQSVASSVFFRMGFSGPEPHQAHELLSEYLLLKTHKSGFKGDLPQAASSTPAFSQLALAQPGPARPNHHPALPPTALGAWRREEAA